MSEKIVFVCTANLCRSPMAQVIFHNAATSAGQDFEVSSCGFLEPGRRPPREVLETIRGFGGDLSGHRSAGVSTVLQPEVDLILTMTKQQVRQLMALNGSLAMKAFSLKEFVRLGEVEGSRGQHESLQAYVGRVAAGRPFSKTLPESREDIADPIGKRKRAYEQAARELENYIKRLLMLIVARPNGSRPTGRARL